MVKIISFANHKGGVGKTSSTVNIGAGLSKLGQHVLLIDLDPQANLSLSLGIGEIQKTIYSALRGGHALADAIVNVTANLDVVPSTLDLTGAELELSSETGREFVLKDLIDSLKKKYDYILIDCPPSLGLLTLNALTASDEVYIPLQAQFLATQGLAKLKDVIEKIKKRHNKKLVIGGVFLTQYDDRKILNRDVAKAVTGYFPDKMFKTKIRDNIAIGEAPSSGVDIFRYDKKSYGATDYLSLTKEMLKRTQKSAANSK